VLYINVEPWSSQDFTDRQIIYVCVLPDQHNTVPIGGQEKTTGRE